MATKREIINWAGSGTATAILAATAFLCGVMVGYDIPRDGQETPPMTAEVQDAPASEVPANPVTISDDEIAVSVLPLPVEKEMTEAQKIFNQELERLRADRAGLIEDARRTVGYVPEGQGQESTSNVQYAAVAGSARVLDTGMIYVDGQSIALAGIIPIPPDAFCESGDGTSFDCYNWALEGLKSWVDSRDATCSLTIRGEDMTGACEIPSYDGTSVLDVGSWMVSAGIAVADPYGSGVYDEAQQMAKDTKAGIWSGKFAFDGVAN